MSYDQTFRGSFTFAHAHCLEAGIDAFLARDPDDREKSVFDLDDLEIKGLKVSASFSGFAPASAWFGTETSLHHLGAYAKRGLFNGTFRGDGVEYSRMPAGGRTGTTGLPARHHRWEIYFAVRGDDAKALRALAAQKISLDVRYPELWGYSPLHIAARAGADAAVATLLELGLAVDALAGGTSPLHVAASLAVAKRLLAAGAAVDRVDEGGSPLSCAITRDAFDIATLLLEAGGTIPKAAAVDVCEVLAEGKHLELLTALCARDGRLTAALKKPSVMLRAVRGGEQVVVDFLLQHGARLPKDLLEKAIGAGSVPLVELALRDAKALRQSAASNRDKDAMCQAATRNAVPIMEVLLANGLPVSPAKKGETSPLHRSAIENRGEALAWLLRHGAVVDTLDKDGRTPLAKAIWLGAHEAAKTLCRAGASLDLVKNVSDDEMAAFRRAAGKLVPKAKPAPVEVAPAKKPPTAEKKAAKKPRSTTAKKKPAKKTARKRR